MKRLTVRRLEALLGAEVAARLLCEWGGHRLPRLTTFHVKRATRDEAIRQALETDTTVAVARRFGLSQPRIVQIGKL